MKRIILLALFVASAMALKAQTTADTIAAKRQLDSLRNQRAELKEQIRQADAQRNQTIAGVSAENMERLNRAQDSLCLVLRSQMTAVECRIAELEPRKERPSQSQLINSLRNRKNEEGKPQSKEK